MRIEKERKINEGNRNMVIYHTYLFSYFFLLIFSWESLRKAIAKIAKNNSKLGIPEVVVVVGCTLFIVINCKKLSKI